VCKERVGGRGPEEAAEAFTKLLGACVERVGQLLDGEPGTVLRSVAGQRVSDDEPQVNLLGIHGRKQRVAPIQGALRQTGA